MNNTYFNKEIFPEKEYNTNDNKIIKPINYNISIPFEQSFIENILRLNRGKKINIYMIFPNNNEQCFQGILEVSGKDHIAISEPSTGKWHILPINYIEYITFDENINYS